MCPTAGQALTYLLILYDAHTVGADTRERQVAPDVAGLADHGLWLMGVSDAGRGFAITRLDYPLSQVIACFGGGAEVFVGGKWQKIGPGQAYLMPAHRLHAYRTIPGRRWRFCWAFLLDTAGRPPVIGRDAAVCIPADPAPLRLAILGLHAEAAGAANAAALHHWAWLVRHAAMKIVGPGARLDPLLPVWEKVDARLDLPWTVEALAEEARISPEHVRRLCLRHMGCTPMAHVTRLRMRRAAGLLLSSPCNIEDVAQRVGYSNAFAFSTAFKRGMGKTPSAYRRGEG